LARRYDGAVGTEEGRLTSAVAAGTRRPNELGNSGGKTRHFGNRSIPVRFLCVMTFTDCLTVHLTFDVRGGPLAGRPLDGGVRASWRT
jgi:hypothetical protein